MFPLRKASHLKIFSKWKSFRKYRDAFRWCQTIFKLGYLRDRVGTHVDKLVMTYVDALAGQDYASFCFVFAPNESKSKNKKPWT